ncbi:MAG: TetR/AcrR family transcriptional regulator [Gemmatimonadales bacterium]
MPSRTEISKDAILKAAQAALMQHGAHKVTVDGVARRAGCAKGLVHYHFKTKQGLLMEAARGLVADRCGAWREVLSGGPAKQAITEAWDVLAAESADGTVRAWISLFGPEGPLPDQMVKEALAALAGELGSGTERLFARSGLKPTIPAAEVGWLLGAVIHGMGLQLQARADERDLEGAFAAAWLGALSLFR